MNDLENYYQSIKVSQIRKILTKMSYTVTASFKTKLKTPECKTEVTRGAKEERLGANGQWWIYWYFGGVVINIFKKV